MRSSRLRLLLGVFLSVCLLLSAVSGHAGHSHDDDLEKDDVVASPPVVESTTTKAVEVPNFTVFTHSCVLTLAHHDERGFH
jgi:hypothetical protein